MHQGLLKMDHDLQNGVYPIGWDKTQLPMADKNPELQTGMKILHDKLKYDSYSELQPHNLIIIKPHPNLSLRTYH